jgi:hypothetical protein
MIVIFFMSVTSEKSKNHNDGLGNRNKKKSSEEYLLATTFWTVRHEKFNFQYVFKKKTSSDTQLNPNLKPIENATENATQ